MPQFYMLFGAIGNAAIPSDHPIFSKWGKEERVSGTVLNFPKRK